jgi:hypothetical protein
MRSLARVAGLVASLAAMFGFGSAVAQPYYGYPPGYYAAPPPPPPHYYYARHYHHHYYHHYYYAHYYAGCAYRRHRAGAIGAVAGGIGGGIIGAAITHGNPAFAMIGAGAGALTGNAIGRNSHPYPC